MAKGRRYPSFATLIKRRMKRIQKEVRKLVEDNPIEVISEKIREIEESDRILKWISTVNWLAKEAKSRGDRKFEERAYNTKDLLLIELYKRCSRELKLEFQPDCKDCVAFICPTIVGYQKVFHIPIAKLKRMGFRPVTEKGEIILAKEKSVLVPSNR